MIPKEEQEAIFATIEEDDGFMKEFVEDFLNDVTQDVQNISGVIQKQDGVELERLAHSLKSVVGFFKATTPYNQARELEYLGKEKNFDEAPKKFEEFKITLDELKGLLASTI